jgi:hypothetical protein
MAKNVHISYKINGELTNAYSVVLASEDGTFGIKQASDGTVVAPYDTPVNNTSTGIYEYPFDEAETGLVYIVAWKIVRTEGSSPKYITQQIGPFTDEGYRAIADEKGTFIAGTAGTLLLRITSFQGVPVDPESISITIRYDANNELVKTGTPEKATSGFYVYEWDIPANQTTGKYNATWSFIVDGEEGSELQSVIVAADGDDSEIYSGRAQDIKSVLEQYLYCCQNVPVYFEQARPSEDNKIYRFTFPRWNQSPGIKIYRNKKDQLITNNVEINYFNGILTFDNYLTPYDKIYADYNFRWFNDEELYDFLQMAMGAFNVQPPASPRYTLETLPDYWVTAIVYHAAADALRRLMLCLNFQEPRYVFGGDDQFSTTFSNFDTIKKNYEESYKQLFEQKKLGPYPKTIASVVPSYTLPGGRSLGPETKVFLMVSKGDSRIYTAREAYDLFHSGHDIKIQSQNDETKEIIFVPIGQVFSSGIKEIFVLETKKGLKIECSDDHLFFADGIYIPLKKMKPGDKLVICDEDNILSDDEVKTITKTKEKVEMLDFDVPKYRNLFAGKIKCHNSRWFRMLYSTNN